MFQRLPIVPSIANYRFGTTLDGVEYVIDVRWNGRDEAWYLDLMEADGTMIRAGMKVVLGYPLGARCVSDAFPSGFFFAADQTNGGTEAEFNDFGSRVVIDYVPFSDWEAI